MLNPEREGGRERERGGRQGRGWREGGKRRGTRARKKVDNFSVCVYASANRRRLNLMDWGYKQIYYCNLRPQTLVG